MKSTNFFLQVTVGFKRSVFCSGVVFGRNGLQKPLRAGIFDRKFENMCRGAGKAATLQAFDLFYLDFFTVTGFQFCSEKLIFATFRA